MNTLKLITLAVMAAISVMACGQEITMGRYSEDSELLNEERERDRPVWAKTGTLAVGAGEAKPVSMQATFDDIGAHTLQFIIQPGTKGLDTAKPQAIITWSVSGNQIVRKIDVANGTSISGIGEAVQVRITDVSSGADPTNEYQVTVVVGSGTRATTATPPTLSPEESQRTINAGASAVFVIPENCGAKQFMVLCSSFMQPPPQATETVFAVQRNSATDVSTTQVNPSSKEWIPLNPNVVDIQVFNNTAVPIFCFVVYGIDG